MSLPPLTAGTTRLILLRHGEPDGAVRDRCHGRLDPGLSVIVSHRGVNRIALAAALDLEPRRIFRLAQAYACVNVIDYIGAEPMVRVMNAKFESC